MVTQKIYKICRQGEYNDALKAGVFKGSPDDLSDGFIHFSTAQQVEGTLSKHFKGETDLILLKLTDDSFGSELKWETSRGGALFPHLYGVMEMSCVLETACVHWNGHSHNIEEGFIDE